MERYDGRVAVLEQNDVLAVFKALSNPTRLRILGWLKDPIAHFPPQPDLTK